MMGAVAGHRARTSEAETRQSPLSSNERGALEIKWAMGRGWKPGQPWPEDEPERNDDDPEEAA